MNHIKIFLSNKPKYIDAKIQSHIGYNNLQRCFKIQTCLNAEIQNQFVIFYYVNGD